MNARPPGIAAALLASACALLGLAPAQAAPSAPARVEPFPVCHVDRKGHWELELGTTRNARRVTLLAPGGTIEAELDPRHEAAGTTWYRTSATIDYDGVRYAPTGGEWSPGTAVRRYLRHVGQHAGVPVFAPWPLSGASEIEVLVRQDGCVFRRYRPVDAPHPVP